MRWPRQRLETFWRQAQPKCACRGGGIGCRERVVIYSVVGGILLAAAAVEARSRGSTKSASGEHLTIAQRRIDSGVGRELPPAVGRSLENRLGRIPARGNYSRDRHQGRSVSRRFSTLAAAPLVGPR
jgi:hypothetical protein